LEQQLADGIGVARCHFYLGNTHFTLQNWLRAIKHYRQRIALGGWYEEVWYSHYKIGLAYQATGHHEQAIGEWLKAYQVHPHRSENIYQICKWYREQCQYHLAHSFYQWGKRIQRLPADVLFIETDVYEWKFDFEFSILAWHVGQKDAVMDVCQRLLNTPGVDHDVIKANMQYYCPKLASICKQKVDLASQVADKVEGFTASTPSITPLKNRYVVNVRYVDYDINRADGKYSPPKKNITTINKRMTLTRPLKTLQEFTFPEPETDLLYRGVEDVRLYTTAKHEIVYTGNSNLSGDGMRACVAAYELDGSSLAKREIPSPEQRSCEKNWVIAKDDVLITDWYPMRVGAINRDGQFALHRTIETPHVFQFFRGSSNGSAFGASIFFVVHMVHHAAPRVYYHCLVELKAGDLSVVRVSQPFSFEGESIEYCLGCIVEHDRILMTYSTWDKTSNLAVYPKKDLFRLIGMK
jgi:hypothetical protein